MSHAIDISKGERRGEVSAQWANRSDDERFLNLSSLHAATTTWRQESYGALLKPADITAEYDENDPSSLVLRVGDIMTHATNIGFGQVCSLAEAPAAYLRTLPGPLAAMNLNYGLQAVEQRAKQAYIRQPAIDGVDETRQLLRGITSTKYGRIYDNDVVAEVMKFAGDGVGDTRWKVPGTIDWNGEFGVTYNSHVDITKETTTLYASDRDVFLFLVDDTHPIEVGKLPSGEPDLMFRGFYVWNSEIGQRTFGVATMYLRGVCQNRNLWGVEGFSELTFKHTTGAPERFLKEATPALEAYAADSTDTLLAGVKAAKEAKVATNMEERIEFLKRFGFSEKQARAAIATAEAEEQAPPESVWDMAQAVSAMARTEQYQEKRLHMEIIAGKMLDKVTS